MASMSHPGTRILLRKKKPGIDDVRLRHLCGIEKCMQCGRCTASCPASYLFEDFTPRDIMRRLSMGETGMLLSSGAIWKCGQCYSCRMRCPRDNSAGMGILALRERSVREGIAPGYILRIASIIKSNLYERGETFLPSMITDSLLAEFGPRTLMRCSGNRARRIRIGYHIGDARQEPIPGASMDEIRMIMRLTGYIPDGGDENSGK